MKRNDPLVKVSLGLLLALAACGGGAADAGAGSSEDQAFADEHAAHVAAQPAPTGTVIEVAMITDDLGNRFDPAEVEARPGDVIRFKLVSGVHNVSFPADKNPGKSGLPAPGEYLQLPGQTQDLVVNLPAGEYTFQCDPHAALGMVGKLVVKP
ncbi:MAG TPA: plastocyanin/azurin family copper-binding protein [Longimicrobiales bacterium]